MSIILREREKERNREKEINREKEKNKKDTYSLIKS